jgi:uncharacterized membrane protein YGL010W
MRTADAWFDEYGDSHRHATNKLLHWICVPVIVLSVMGLLWEIPVPQALEAVSPWLNWATLATIAAFFYYFAISVPLGVAMVPALGLLLWAVYALDMLETPLWLISISLFVVAWIGQFIGHAIEGKRPSFFKDVQFLLIGPLWLVAHVFRRAGIRY